jgi:putative alpha-1,2-mannosidase
MLIRCLYHTTYTNQEQIIVYISISFVSTEQARINLQSQTKLEPFDSIRELVQQKWLTEMSRSRYVTLTRKKNKNFSFPTNEFKHNNIVWS